MLWACRRPVSSPEPPDFTKQKRKNKMSKIFGAFLALALLVGASAAYAWDQQATDEQMGYSLNHRAAPGTPNSYLGEVPTTR